MIDYLRPSCHPCLPCRYAPLLVVSVGLILLSGLASLAAEEPEWLRQRPHDANALYGIGQASGENAREQSRARAVVEISEQLVISIASSSESISESDTVIVEGSGGGGSNADEEPDQAAAADGEQLRLREYFSRRIHSDTESHFLPGVEIVRQETVGDTVYTLARLERQRFVGAVQERAAMIDRNLEAATRLGDQDLSGAQLQQLQRAHALGDERQRLARLLVGQGARLDEAPVDLDALARRLGRLAQGNRVALEGSSRAPDVRDALLDMLDISGLTVIQDDSANFQLRLRQRQRSREVGDWHRVSITGAITVVDRASGEVLGSLEETVEKSSTQGEAEAAARAREALIEKLGETLNQRLLRLMAGLGER